MRDELLIFTSYIHALVGTRIKNDRGASAVEYGLLVAAIAAVIVAIVFGLGKLILGAFSHTSTCIGNSGTC